MSDITKEPFFSILIPTKNRSHIVGFAIQSVLEQTFGDFEIIVSDNDDSETLTRDAVSKFSDPRIKYYRTSGNLSMPDNWEFALSKANGQYITVLEDKQAFYPNALEIIYRCASITGAKAIAWSFDLLDDTKEPIRLTKPDLDNTVCLIPSSELLHAFAQSCEYNRFPMLLNSCVHRDIVEFVVEKTPLKRFFVHVSPDVCSGFIQLNYIDHIIYINAALSVFGARKLSNGYKITNRLKGHEQFIKEVGEDHFYDYVPIKSTYILSNCIVNDFLRLKSLLSGNLADIIISPRVYAFACFRDIITAFAYGANNKREIKLWREYIRTQPSDVRSGLWFWAVKQLCKIYISRLLTKLRLINIIYRIHPNRLKRRRSIMGYATVIDVVRDVSLHPNVNFGTLDSIFDNPLSE